MRAAKSIRLIFTLSLIVSWHLALPCNAQVKADVTKSGSKIQSGIQKLVGKAQSTMESIQGSQFGQFIGDGIKYAKEGIGYAKKAYDDGMKLVKETKDKVENSTAYKSALLSKEIAEETSKLKSIGEEIIAKQEEIREEYELLRAQNKAKSDLLIQNQQIIDKVQEQNGSEGIVTEKSGASTTKEDNELTDKSYSFYRKESIAFAKAEISEEEDIGELAKQAIARQGVVPNALSKEEIINAQNALDGLMNQYMIREIKEVAEKYARSIAAVERSIAQKAKELKELTQKEDKSETTENNDPQKPIKANIEKFFNIEGGGLGVKTRDKIKDMQSEYIKEKSKEIFSGIAEKREKMKSQAEEAETFSLLSGTMPGESENSGVNTEVLVKQIETLESLINMMIADLQQKTIFALKALNEEAASEPKGVFNLCDYTDSSNVGCLKSVINQAKETVNNIEGRANDLKEKAQNIKEQVENNVDKARDAAQKIQDTVDSEEDLKTQEAEISTEEEKASISTMAM